MSEERPQDRRDQRLRRRIRTVPVIYVAGAIYLVLVIPLCVIGAIFDVVRGRPRLPSPRVVLFGAYYLGWEWYAVTASGLMFVATGFGRLMSRPWAMNVHRAMQVSWANGLIGAMVRFLGMRLEIGGDQCVSPGPVIVFCRHTSMIDTLLPAHVLSERGGLQLRYVLKHELLSDPALDIVGNRIPNHFVDRSGHNTRAELEAIATLAAGTGPGESFTIFPEGSRFTPEKRARAIERLDDTDPELAARARRLVHTMPPRPGGPLAILRATPGVDVVFMAHTGLEGLSGVADVWRIVPFRWPVQLTCWRIPAGEIPESDEDRVDWLFHQWQRVDDWIGAHQRPGA